MSSEDVTIHRMTKRRGGDVFRAFCFCRPLRVSVWRHQVGWTMGLANDDL
jgi:hypothetical protein